MKKTLALILVLALMLPWAGLAETVYYGKEDAALVQGITAAAEAENRIEGFNAALQDASSVCLITQQEMIESLQGYSDGDVRTDVKMVKVLAQGDLYVLCSADTAQEAGLSDLASLKAYLEENEYELQIMRSFDASNADYASLVLMDAISFDSEMFVDDQDKWQSLGDGLYIVVADTAKALELAQAGNVVLGALTEKRTAEYPDLPCAAECGVPVVRGTYYALIAGKDADVSAWQDVTLADEVLAPLYLHQPDGNISLEKDVQTYVDYMTAEGLFFY